MKLDEKSFEQLFRTYYASLCNYSYTMTADLPDSENIVQDVFVGLWNNRKETDIPGGSTKSYLFSATRNRTLNLLKHRAIEEKHMGRVVEMIDELSRSGSFEEDQQRIAMIKAVIDSMPPQRKRVFTLNYLDGKKYKEIAAELGISVHSVKEHIVKAYREIRGRVLK